MSDHAPHSLHALRRRHVVLAAGAPLLCPWLSGCGGGVGEAATVAAIVPYFTFQFGGVVTSQGQRMLAFANLDADHNAADATTGTLGGFTNLRIESTTGQTLAFSNAEGTFRSDRLGLRLAAPKAPLAPAYDGRFTAPDTLRMTPDPASVQTPVLTVLRIDNSFRPALFGVDWKGTDGSGRSRTLRLQARDEGHNDLNGAIVFFTGTDLTAGLPDATVEGWAVMRMLEMTVTRGGQSQTVTGVLSPAGTTPPGNQEVVATGMALDDGSRLARAA